MALTDKNIVITPNVGQTDNPKIVFSGADATTSAQDITLRVYATNNGTLSFEGSAGQLFSIANTLTGTIFSVNDISGIPSIEVLDTGLIKLAQYSGNVLIGTGIDDGVNKLQINGSISLAQMNIDKIGTIKSITDFLQLTNRGNAVDMDGTGTGILFKQYYSGATSAVNSGRVASVTETDWTSTASTQDSALTFYTTLDGTLTEKVRISSGGLVGIGTTTPTQDLSFGGNSTRNIWMERHTTSDTAGNYLRISSGGATVGATNKAGGDLYLRSGISTGTGTSNIYFETATAGTSGTADVVPDIKMTILGSGNVGIGVQTPSRLLDLVKSTNSGASADIPSIRVSNSLSTQGNGTSTYNFSSIEVSTGNSAVRGGLIASYNSDAVYSDTIRFFSYTNHALVFGTNNTERVRILNDGKVGIGTKSPNYLLQINGAGTDDVRLQFTNTDTGTTVNDGFHIGYDNSENAIIRNKENTPLSFWTNDTQRVTILADGKVGIGTASPTSLLSLTGETSQIFGMERRTTTNTVGNSLTVQAGGATSGATDKNGGDLNLNSGIATGTGSSNIYLSTVASGGSGTTDGTLTTRVAVLGNGNVGVGTNTPISKFQVYDTIDTALTVHSAGTNSATIIDLIAGNGTTSSKYSYIRYRSSETTPQEWRVGQYGSLNYSIRDFTQSTEVLTATTTGNIGIGTTTPSSKLEVRGVITSQNYKFPTVGATAQWVKLGRFTCSQDGGEIKITCLVHNGFNALNSQDFETFIYFKTSNGASLDGNGFAGNSWYYCTGNNIFDMTPKWKSDQAGTLATYYDLYLSVPAYSETSVYSVTVVEGSIWLDSKAVGQTDPGSGSTTVCVSTKTSFNIFGNIGIGTPTPSSYLDIQKTGTIKNITNFIELTNDNTATDMDGTGTAILFNQYYYHATTPSVVNAGRIAVLTETDWTSTALTQDSAMIFQTSADGVLAEKLRVSSNGNVGIGSTSPSDKLHIYQGNIRLQTSNGGIQSILGYEASDANPQMGIDFNYAGAGIDNRIDISAYSSGSAAPRLSITNGGNIGIGTTSPSAYLDFEKAGTVKTTTDFIELTNSGNAADMDSTGTGILFNQYYFDNTTPAVISSARIATVTETDWTSTATTQDASLTFSTVLNGALAEKVRINSLGNVGIGTNSPQTKLHVYHGDNSGVIEGLRLQGVFNGRTGSLMRFTNYHANGTVPNAGEYNLAGVGAYDFSGNWDGALAFYTSLGGTAGGTALTQRMTINNVGKVGIGTTTPAYKLHVYEANAQSDIIIGSGATGDAVLILDASDGDGTGSDYMVIQHTRSGNKLQTKYGGTTLMTTLSTGEVGINNVAPSEKLHVDGNIRIDDSAGNDGFKISYNNTSKTLDFIFVGV